MPFDIGALAQALGMGAQAGAAGYNVDEERRRKEQQEALAERRLGDQERRQSLLDQANVDHLGAETRKLNEPEKDAFYPVPDNPGYAINRRTGKAVPLTAPDTGQPFKPRPRPWAPSSEGEALDFDAKKQRNRATNRGGSTAGAVTPRMRQTFLQQRLQFHLNPRADPYGDPVAGTGLDPDEARTAAEADVEAAYGPEGGARAMVGAPPGAGSVLRGGMGAPPERPTPPGGAATGAPAARPARAATPTRQGASNTVTHGAADAVLSPQTGAPLRKLNDRERQTAASDPGFRAFLAKKGYRPVDWQ